MAENTTPLSGKYLWLLVPAALITAVDLWTKHVVMIDLPLNKGIFITDFFNLVHVRNMGAAFGFLNDPSTPWAARLFLGATVVAAVVIVWIARSARSRAFVLALGLILGGAVGNAVDRARFGAVVDFLDFHYNGMHWPAFNVADIAICCGAALALILSLRRSPPEKAGR